MMKIAVAGTGYVGMSIATLLAQKNHVTAVDVIPEKVEKINKRISPIQDEYIGKCPKFEVIANLEVESVVNTFAVIIHLKLSHYGNDRLRKRV